MPNLKKPTRPRYLPKKNSRGNERSNPFHKTNKWRKTSERYRNAYPLCEYCQWLAMVEPADHVDHVIPLGVGGAKYDPRNLMGLCAPHHGMKSGLDKTKFVAQAKRIDDGLIPVDRDEVKTKLLGERVTYSDNVDVCRGGVF